MPTTIANYTTARDNTKEDINVRSAGWCSDWPSGSTWMPPVLGSTDPDQTNSFGSNYAAFGNKAVDAQMDAIQRMPLAQQAAAWNALDKQIAQKYFPLFTTYYGGVAQAHGSRSRATTTTTPWACRPGRTSGSRSSQPPRTGPLTVRR